VSHKTYTVLTTKRLRGAWYQLFFYINTTSGLGAILVIVSFTATVKYPAAGSRIWAEVRAAKL